MPYALNRRAAITAALIAVSMALPATAAARSAPITGTLSKAGYTVVALGYDGKAVSSRSRSFRLAPRSSRVTLQLRDARGKYAGPVIVGRTRGRAVFGLKKGAKLGRVVVKRGYALTARPVARRLTDRGRAAARRGAPAGNGRNFGLVRSKLRGPAGTGGDQDRDGVPNAFDIDSDGDLVLNPVDGSGDARASQYEPRPGDGPGDGPADGGEPGPGPEPAGFNNFSQLFLEVHETVNANAAAVSQADIDAAVKKNLAVIMLQIPDGATLDCGGLSYCSSGGTGAANAEPWRDNPGQPFPSCCDADGDGLATMPLNERGEFRLSPNATSAEIGSGDTMIQHLSDGRELPGSLAFVFNTVPAVSEWRDAAGNTGTFDYPVPAGSPGTGRNPLEIAPDASGRYSLTYTFWRPQRRAIATAGEGDGYIDIGGLEYEANVPEIPRSGAGEFSAPQCPTASLSTSDPSLTVKPDLGDGRSQGRLADSAPDRASDPANELTFSVDLSRCAELRGGSLAPGDQLNVDVSANPSSHSAHDVANQAIFVRLR